MAYEINRRSALTVMGAGAAAGLTVSPGFSLARTAARRTAMPWLYSPDQLQAELWLLRLIQEPAVKAIQAKIRADLAVGDRAKLPDAAATLDNAIAQWTNSLIFAALIHRPTRPVFLWSTDDTPREWLGHKLPGVGTSGDNPDAIYRTAAIEGGGRYEILGQYHPASSPTQLLIEADAGDMAKPQNIMPTAGGKHADIHSASMLSDKDFRVAADRSFRITVSPEATGGPNHMQIPASGYAVIGVRDILGDWNLRPSKLTIRRLDPVRPEPWTYATVRARVLADLDGYVRFWAHFPDIWFGGLKANAHSEPMQRPGGWGFVAGLNFHLADDEAMLVKTTRGGAKYTGFQLNDPWMIAPDARIRQVCLNNSQTIASPDGTTSYVISKTDPGVANWLDTCGMRDGLGIIRWQNIPESLTKDGLIADSKVIKLADVAALGLPSVTPAQRRGQVAARFAAYSSRTR
ncbi:MAG: hypothetical protein ABIM50_08405 [Novosphingobium sp.]